MTCVGMVLSMLCLSTRVAAGSLAGGALLTTVAGRVPVAMGVAEAVERVDVVEAGGTALARVEGWWVRKGLEAS